METPPEITLSLNNNYAWEEDYKRSWEIIKEDDSGSLQHSISNLQTKSTKKQYNHQKTQQQLKRGLVRYLIVVIDLSQSTKLQDFFPTRAQCIVKCMHTFLVEFFDQNPISQISLVTTNNEQATLLTPLSSHPYEHLSQLDSVINKLLLTTSTDDLGEPSLLNVLNLCTNLLTHVPIHGTKEVLVVSSSLTTCDLGCIQNSIDLASKQAIRVSVVSLAAEIRILKLLTSQTSGSFAVAMNESHFKDLILDHIPPPVLYLENFAKQAGELIEMGFPEFKVFETYSLCACHNTPTLSGFVCPQCQSNICNVPNECVVCGLNLVLSPHLARTYHHLFPIDTYQPVTDWTRVTTNECGACMISLPPPPEFTMTQVTGRYACPKCLVQVCNECDVYIHDVLHNCPICYK